jgi:hypothetical protein
VHPISRPELDAAVAELRRAAQQDAYGLLNAAKEGLSASIKDAFENERKLTDSKLENVGNELKWLRRWGAGAILAGNAVAGLAAAIITRTTPPEAVHTAMHVIAQLH